MFNRSPFLLGLGMVFMLTLLWFGNQEISRLIGKTPTKVDALAQVVPFAGQPVSSPLREVSTAAASQAAEEIAPITADSGAPVALDFGQVLVSDPVPGVTLVDPVLRSGDIQVAPYLVRDEAFENFLQTLPLGGPYLPVGVYVTDVLALPIIQQPAGDAAFVSPRDGTVTQFSSASRQGVTGLLAHNYLSGAIFYSLEVGDDVQIVYSDGSFQGYRIEQIDQFQRLDFTRLNGDFIELSTGSRLTSGDVFGRFYRNGDRVTFQTCLDRNGNASWGLTFWTAVPVDR